MQGAQVHCQKEISTPHRRRNRLCLVWFQQIKACDRSLPCRDPESLFAKATGVRNPLHHRLLFMSCLECFGLTEFPTGIVLSYHQYKVIFIKNFFFGISESYLFKTVLPGRRPVLPAPPGLFSHVPGGHTAAIQDDSTKLPQGVHVQVEFFGPW